MLEFLIAITWSVFSTLSDGLSNLTFNCVRCVLLLATGESNIYQIEDVEEVPCTALSVVHPSISQQAVDYVGDFSEITAPFSANLSQSFSTIAQSGTFFRETFKKVVTVELLKPSETALIVFEKTEESAVDYVTPFFAVCLLLLATCLAYAWDKDVAEIEPAMPKEQVAMATCHLEEAAELVVSIAEEKTRARKVPKNKKTKAKKTTLPVPCRGITGEANDSQPESTWTPPNFHEDKTDGIVTTKKNKPKYRKEEKSNIKGFKTDTQISDRKVNTGGSKERVLKRWTPDASIPASSVMEWKQQPTARKFKCFDPEEMFRMNMERFGVKTSFDPSLSQYTTPLPGR